MDVSSRPHLETFEGFVFLLHLTPIGERIVRKSYSLKTLYALQSICSKFAARFTGLTILEPFLDSHCKAVWEASSKLARKHEMGHKCSMCPHPRRNRRKRSNRSPEVVPGCHLCRSKKTDPIHYSRHLKTLNPPDKACETCNILFSNNHDRLLYAALNREMEEMRTRNLWYAED